jgi:hypothetical protein
VSRWARMAIAAGVLLALAPRPARADDAKKACTAAYDAAQSLRDAHKLREAREQLRICSQSSCTAFIARDCTEWLDAVERSLPTVVFSAKDRAGRDVLQVRVTVDGQPLVEALDGTAVPVDAGPHTFRFEQADGTSATQQVLVKEGDKNVGVAVVLAREAPAAAVEAPRASPPLVLPHPPEAEVPPPDAPRAGRTIGLLLGGVGVAGLAGGAVTGLLAMSTWSTAKHECPTHVGCSQQALHDQSLASGLATASTAAFVAGGVLGAVGAVLILTAPAGHAARVGRKPAHFTVGVTLAPGAFGLTGDF